jgi:hypothetical protein
MNFFLAFYLVWFIVLLKWIICVTLLPWFGFLTSVWYKQFCHAYSVLQKACFNAKWKWDQSVHHYVCRVMDDSLKWQFLWWVHSFLTFFQCCGSGIQCLLPLDPGTKIKIRIRDEHPRSSESLETIFGVKNTKILWSGSEIFLTLDPGSTSRIRNSAFFLLYWKGVCSNLGLIHQLSITISNSGSEKSFVK